MGEPSFARITAATSTFFPTARSPTGVRYCMNGVALKFEPQT
jgi:peptide methionine sulfoxide reductase MsrB